MSYVSPRQWYTARDPNNGAYVMRIGVIPPAYHLTARMDDESWAAVVDKFGVDFNNITTLHLDMERAVVWLDGLPILTLYREPDVEEFEAGGCPVCHCRGTFVRMALCCPTHGPYAGC